MSRWDKASQRALAFIEFNDVELEDIFKFLNKCYDVTPAREIKADITAELKHRRSKLENQSPPPPPAIPDFGSFATGRIKAAKEILDIFGPEFPAKGITDFLKDELNKRESYVDLSGDIRAYLDKNPSFALSAEDTEALIVFLSKMGYKK